MKHTMIRPVEPKGCARIVLDINDSTRDKFIDAEEARKMLNFGELRTIDLGPQYLLTYMYPKK